MSTVTNPTDRRKSGALDSTGISGIDSPVAPVWITPRPNPGEIELVDELLESGATLAGVKVFRFLARCCDRYRQACTWVYQTTIARVTGLGNSTVRVALDWLEDRGWITRSPWWIHGEDREVIWCCWDLRLPGRLDRQRYDLGGGVTWDGSTEQSIPFDGAVFDRPSADFGAQKTAPKVSKRIRNTLKTTDREVVVVVDSSRDPGDGEPSTLAIEPPPAPAIDPGLAAFLAAELPDDDDERAAIEAEIPGWLARWRLAIVERAIREALARRREASSGRKAPIRTTLAAFAAGILETWEREGHSDTRCDRRKLKSPPVNAPTAEVVEANRAKQAALRQLDPRELWEKLDQAERDGYLAAFDREVPRLAGMPAKLWEATRIAGGIERMMMTRGGGEATAEARKSPPPRSV